MVLSVLSPLNPGNNTCGYCGPSGARSSARSNYHAAECISTQLSCQVYQDMLDRGWRRSGTYLYKPDLKRSCCPQYTIRLPSNEFQASKSQRKLVNRFNRFIVNGDSDQDDASTAILHSKPGEASKHPKGGKASQSLPAFQLESAIHAAETNSLKGKEVAHVFETTLEPSSYTKEKFALYQSYQREIHHEEEKQPGSFKRFLVETSLREEQIPYPETPPEHLPRAYGSYHMLYRLDGKLVAMGVLDILPECVSSVYFMYEKDWERLSLGKLSALREISLVREINAAGVTGMQYLYMGFYIQSCQKMRYKGEYSPSYLLDPVDYTWHPLQRCKSLLEKTRYATFTDPAHSIAGAYEGPEHDPDVLPSDLDKVTVFLPVNGRAMSVSLLAYLKMESQSGEHEGGALSRAANTLVDALGLPLSQADNVILWFKYVIS